MESALSEINDAELPTPTDNNSNEMEENEIEADLESNNIVVIESTNRDSDENSTTITTNSTNTLGLLDAIIIFTTFGTAGAIIVMPYSFGQFGYVFGSFVFLVIILLMMYFMNFLVDVADTCDKEQGLVKTTCIKVLGDVGHHLWGKKGRFFFTTLQLINLTFYLPGAIETIGISLNYLVNGNCENLWNLISCIVLYIFIQFLSNWHHMAWIGYLTTLIAVTKAFIFLPLAYVEYQEEVMASKEYYIGPSQVFLNPQPKWYNYCIAITGFFYWSPMVFIMFEIRSKMKNPAQCKTAINVSALVQVIIYFVSGVMAVVYWGWNVANPITIEVPSGWLGYYLQVAVMLVTALDYFIAAKIVNEWFRSTFLSRMSKNSILSRLVYTLPLTLFGLAIVLFIPNFGVLIGLLVCISFMPMSTWAVTVAWELGGRKYKNNHVMMLLLGFIGISFNVAGLAGVFYSIVTADYTWTGICGSG